MDNIIIDSNFHQFFTLNPVMMWLSDAHTLQFLEVNEAACRHYGYTREEFLSMTVLDICPPEDVPRLLAAMKQQVGSDYGIWRHRRKNGDLIHVQVFSNVMHFGGKEMRFAIAWDVTKEVQQRQELETARQELEQQLINL